MWVLLAHFSAMLRFWWPSQLSGHYSQLVSSASLLEVYPASWSRSLTKILNRVGPRTDWSISLPTSLQLSFSSPSGNKLSNNFNRMQLLITSGLNITWKEQYSISWVPWNLLQSLAMTPVFMTSLKYISLKLNYVYKEGTNSSELLCWYLNGQMLVQ